MKTTMEEQDEMTIDMMADADESNEDFWADFK